VPRAGGVVASWRRGWAAGGVRLGARARSRGATRSGLVALRDRFLAFRRDQTDIGRARRPCDRCVTAASRRDRRPLCDRRLSSRPATAV
jgi:hypothetical protein